MDRDDMALPLIRSEVPFPLTLAELHRTHYQALVRLAAVMLHDLAAAEDVTQQAFLQVHQARTLKEPDQLLVYLRSAVLNGARSRLRRASVARRWLERVRSVPTGVDPCTRGEDQDLIIRALRQLPTRQREVLVLRHYLDLSEAETARTLGITVGTVKQHLHRAVATVSDLLGVEP